MKKLGLVIFAVAIMLAFACCQSNDDGPVEGTQTTASDETTEAAETTQPTEIPTMPESPTPEPPAPILISDDELAFELCEHYAGTKDEPLNVDFFLRWRQDAYNSDLEYKYDPYFGKASVVMTDYDTQTLTYFDKSLTDPHWIQYIFCRGDFEKDYQRLCKIYSQEYENKRAVVKVLDYGDGVIYGNHGEEISYVYKSYDYTKCTYFPYKRPRYNATGLINVELYLMMPVTYGGVDFYVQVNLLVDIKRGEYEAMLEQYKDVICSENFSISHGDNNKCVRHLASAGVTRDARFFQWFMLTGAEQVEIEQ